MKIAIIGTGISAITLAKHLKKDNFITLFEKSRDVGGRISTRRSKLYEFDHGAQFFTAKNKDFKNFIAPIIKKNIIQRWDARFAEFKNNMILRQHTWDSEYPHYVGAPGMRNILKHLSDDLNIKLNTEIHNITKNNNDCWNLFNTNGENLGDYDWVISTAPAPQSASILPQIYKYHSQLLNKKMLGCFSLMLGFKEPLNLSWDAALISEADISWISVNSSKPMRPKGFTLLIHSTNAWADKNINNDPEKVKKHLIEVTSNIIGHDTSVAEHIDLHGWRYANIEKQEDSNSLIDYKNKLASCGDWLIHGRIESAFKAGLMLAKSINKEL
ncbi:FAD-dependent oxidoreductase [Nitrosomonadales bacterium]|nr:FAD-dependent oxidoreductase [Nitrosomonadales bacterium]